MNSIHIILEQFKRGHLSEEEVISLIEDLYSNKNNQWSNIKRGEMCPKHRNEIIEFYYDGGFYDDGGPC